MGEVSNEHAHLNGWISTLLLMDCKEIKAINLRFKKPSMSDPHFFSLDVTLCAFHGETRRVLSPVW